VLPADAVIYLRGSSEVSHYVLYTPTNSSRSGNVTFTMLAPMVSDVEGDPSLLLAATVAQLGNRCVAQLHCRLPSLTSTSSHSRAAARCCPLQVQEQEVVVRDWHPSGQGSSQDGSSDGDRSYLFAVIYTAEQRNGQLVVTDLAPNALVGATADATGGRRRVTGAGSSSTGGDNSNSSSSGADSPAGSAGAGRGFWALLQGHSRDVEIVDLTGQWSCFLCFCFLSVRAEVGCCS
jgi:hypothetical protein